MIIRVTFLIIARILIIIFGLSEKSRFKVMNTKLTLTIEKEIIAKAKDYAKEKNRSLSDIIETT